MRSSLAIGLVLVAAPSSAAEPRDAVALLQRACFECHGPEKQRGSLRLDSRASTLTGGETGAAVVAGKPDKGELLRRIALPAGAEGAMPPRGARLTAKEQQLLRDWVVGGAAWPAEVAKHWAYVKPVRPKVPDARDPKFFRNPIDAFVLARLQMDGLKPSPEAPREVLIRRLHLDLTGLPPTPDEVEAFVKNDSPDAYEKVVDRLLASPQFGVKWVWWTPLSRPKTGDSSLLPRRLF